MNGTFVFPGRGVCTGVDACTAGAALKDARTESCGEGTPPGRRRRGITSLRYRGWLSPPFSTRSVSIAEEKVPKSAAPLRATLSPRMK